MNALDSDGGPQAWAAWNFHASQLDLVQRIKKFSQECETPWARIVGTRDDMAATQEESQLVPGVDVLYRGPSFKSATESKAEVEHRWRIVVAVAGPVNTHETAVRDEEAGRYLPILLQALHGYIPDGSTAPLVPATPPEPKTSGRYGYYPLDFTALTIYSTRRGPALGPLPLDRR